MVKYSFFRRKLIIAVLFLIGFMIVPTRIQAAGLSPVCALIHSGSINGNGGAGSFAGFTGTANRGETLTVRVALGSATSATFTLNSGPSAGAVLSGPAAAPRTLSFTVGSTPPSGLGWYIQSANGSVNVTADCGFGTNVGSSSGPLFSDGRMNDSDAVETAAVYCQDDGSVRVYVPNVPTWTIGFTASLAEIASVPKKPATHTLIKQGGGARLYRLTTGELQVNSPQSAQADYVFIFKDCPQAAH